MTWDGIKDINASQLSNWTHRKGSPWADIYKEGMSDLIIPNHAINSYFKMILAS